MEGLGRDRGRSSCQLPHDPRKALLTVEWVYQSMFEKIAADEQPGQPVACYVEMPIDRPIQIVHWIELPSGRLTSPRLEFPE
jgi:hypothetical protein